MGGGWTWTAAGYEVWLLVGSSSTGPLDVAQSHVLGRLAPASGAGSIAAAPVKNSGWDEIAVLLQDAAIYAGPGEIR